MEVVAVINEGNSVALGSPGNISQVLVLIKLIFLKYQLYTHGAPVMRCEATVTYHRVWFQRDEFVSLRPTIDKLEENIGTEGRSSPHGLAQLFDEHVLPVSRELVRYRVQLNKCIVVYDFFCLVTLHVVDCEASKLNN